MKLDEFNKWAESSAVKLTTLSKAFIWVGRRPEDWHHPPMKFDVYDKQAKYLLFVGCTVCHQLWKKQELAGERIAGCKWTRFEVLLQPKSQLTNHAKNVFHGNAMKAFAQVTSQIKNAPPVVVSSKHDAFFGNNNWKANLY